MPSALVKHMDGGEGRGAGQRQPPFFLARLVLRGCGEAWRAGVLGSPCPGQQASGS